MEKLQAPKFELSWEFIILGIGFLVAYLWHRYHYESKAKLTDEAELRAELEQILSEA